MEIQPDHSDICPQSDTSANNNNFNQRNSISNQLIRSPKSQHSNNRSLYSNCSFETHGIEKYLVTLERKNAEKYNIILANRIQKLLKEEEKAKRIAEMAYNKTLAIMPNHERKIQEVQFKEVLKKKRQEQEEEQRMKIFTERERRKKHMSQVQQSILKEKKVTFKEIQKNKEIGDQALKEFKHLIRQKKLQKAQVFKFQVEIRKENRSQSQFNYKSKLRQEYEARIKKEKQLYIQTLTKRQELETIESELIQKISQSQNEKIISPDSFSSRAFATYYSQSPEKFA